MNNVVIIDNEPLTKRRKSLYYINDLISSGFYVEYWDMSQYFYPGMRIVDELDDNYVVKLYDLKSLQLNISRIGVLDTIFIVERLDIWSERNFFRLLKKNHCFTVKIDIDVNADLIVSFFDKLKRLSFHKVIDIIRVRFMKLMYLLYKKAYRFKSFNVIISSGSHSCDLKINHSDYEIYLATLKESKLLEKPYILFIDQYLTQHPDEIYILKNDMSTCSHMYLSKMNAFFEHIEKKWNLEVVIAGHPKSDYPSDAFNGRKIVKYKTALLTRDAEYVITYSSNAISYIMLFDRPLLFICDSFYKNVDKDLLFIKRLANECGKEIFDIDKDPFDLLDKPTTVEVGKRKKYLYNNITSPETEKKFNSDILIRFFKDITTI